MLEEQSNTQFRLLDRSYLPLLISGHISPPDTERTSPHDITIDDSSSTKTKRKAESPSPPHVIVRSFKSDRPEIKVHILGSEDTSDQNKITPEITKSDQSSESSVWDDFRKPDVPSNILFMHEPPTSIFDIKAASIDKIISRLLIPLDDTDEYQVFLNTIFVTFRSFISPDTLLNKFTQAYEHGNLEEKERVCKVLTYWLTTYDYDFLKKKNQLVILLKNFVRSIQNRATDLDDSPNLNYFLSVFEEKITKGSYKSIYRLSNQSGDSLSSRLPKHIESATFMDLDEEEIARHISLTDQMIYSDIEPYELQNQAWNKPQLKDRSPNISELILKFNEFSDATVSLIVSTPKLKDRIRVVKKFIKIAADLRKMRNFNSLMAILSALSNSAVNRLKSTFLGLKKKYHKTLSDLREEMRSENSYKNLREILESTPPPCVPFPGMYLSDLIFVEEGNANMNGELINFRKRKLEYEVLQKFLRFQGIGADYNYNFRLVPHVIQIISSLKQLSEKEQYDMSLECESRP